VRERQRESGEGAEGVWGGGERAGRAASDHFVKHYIYIYIFFSNSHHTQVSIDMNTSIILDDCQACAVPCSVCDVKGGSARYAVLRRAV
jgi:hypothetical protein